MMKLIVNRWIIVSLLFFLITGLSGAFLRMTFFAPVDGINFKYFLHAHSHVAFLGWVFNALFACLVYQFIPEDHADHYRKLFVIFQITVIGMLIFFPIQGYDTFSIIFSTAHVFLSYWFAWRLFRDSLKDSFSWLWINWALIFIVISSLGPFALGYIISSGLSDTYWYDSAIYYYLHFQYNGWFIFAVFGLFFSWLENMGSVFDHRDARILLYLMVFSCFLTLTLSLLWIHPPGWVYLLGKFSALLQLISLIYLFRILKTTPTKVFINTSNYIKLLLLISFLAFVVKIILQILSSFEIFAIMAYENRNLVIGYLHLVFLGIVSFYILAWMIKKNLLLLNKVLKTGIIILIAAFVISELFIILPPLSGLFNFRTPENYFETIFRISTFLPLGITLIFLSKLFESPSKGPGK